MQIVNEQLPAANARNCRAERFQFILESRIVDLQSESCFKARTSDLSVAGCYLDMANPLPVGSEIRLELTHQNDVFTALGKVIHSEHNIGMGVAFTRVRSDQAAILRKWHTGNPNVFPSLSWKKACVAVSELSGTVPAKSGSEGRPRKRGEGVQADLRIGINEFRFFCTETGLGPAVGIYNMTTDEWLAERQGLPTIRMPGRRQKFARKSFGDPSARWKETVPD